MKDIQYADFEPGEYHDRIERARAAMDEAGLDALIVTDCANLRYLFGFQDFLQLSVTRSMLGVFPRDRVEEATLFLPHDCQDAPQSWAGNIAFWDEGHGPPFDDRAVDMAKVHGRLRALGLERGRVGLELGDGTRIGVSVAQFDELRSSLPQAQLRDASPLLWDLRKIKSEAEIQVLRRVGQISARAIQDRIGRLEEGMTEREVYRSIYAAMFNEGIDGDGLLMVLFGVDAWRRPHLLPTDRSRLRRGDPIYIDGGGRLLGYFADVCRTAVCGAPSRQQRLMQEATRQANEAIINATGPGVPVGELYRVGRETLKKKGVSDAAVSSWSFGHGIGLNIHEMPDINLHNHEPLREGMVLSIEPWVLDRSPSGGLFNMEDMVVVRPDRAELLSEP